MNSNDYNFYPSKEEEHELLKQQAKMAAMGEMIGNIAHQWRQPLNALSALNIGLCLKYKRDALTIEEVQKFKEKSNTLIQNMSATIDDFTNFFKPNKVQQLFKIDDAIQCSLKFVGDMYMEHKINILYTPNPNIEINSYKNELIQVLLNILNNSKDAVIEKCIKKPTLTIATVESESDIIIEIQDNAGGINMDIIDRIFEPYFTTKFKSQGTGIGLYMSKMIVEKSMKGSLYSENRDDGLLTTIKIKKENIDWSYAI